MAALAIQSWRKTSSGRRADHEWMPCWISLGAWPAYRVRLWGLREDDYEVDLLKRERTMMRNGRTDNDRSASPAFKLSPRAWCVSTLALGGLFIGAEVMVADVEAKVETATAFVLVDSEGKKRAELHLTEAGAPELVFYDGGAHRRLVLGLDSDGRPALTLLDADGKSARLQSHIAKDGDARLDLYSLASGKPCLAAAVTKAGTSSVNFFDGKVNRMRFEVAADGAPEAIRIVGDRPNTDLVISATKGRVPQITIHDDGQTVFTAP